MKEKIEAFCGSSMCNPTKRKNGTQTHESKIPKVVSRKATWCPNCGHALFWGKKTGHNRHVMKTSVRNKSQFA